MRKTLKHIFFVVVFLMTVLPSCIKEEHELIPRKKLAMIYAEMLITDQWINDNPDIRILTDTSLIYEPILEKYGYTSEDYRHSVNYYLDDPERFSRIFRTASELLDDRYYELKTQKEAIDAEKEKIRRREKYSVDFKLEDHFPYMADEPYVRYYDSLAVEYDTLAKALMIRSIEVKDTIYDRLLMIIRKDTLVHADSLHVSDTLAVSDTHKIKKEVPVKELITSDEVGNGIKMIRKPKDIRNLNQVHTNDFGDKVKGKDLSINELKEIK